MKEMLNTLVQMAKEAHRSAQGLPKADCAWGYYRGLRRGYLGSARLVKHNMMTLEDWQKVCASY